MIHLLRAEPKSAFEYGPFTIRRIHPGRILPERGEDDFGPLSNLDHTNLQPGSKVSMHEHKNDEILSYLWQGSMVHEDEAGQRVPLSPKNLMMMNAGSGLRHEESTPLVAAELLQVSIRPAVADLEGRVQFMRRPEGVVNGEWTLLAGPEGEDVPLAVRQQVYVYDIRLAFGERAEVPQRDGFAQFLYVMAGVISCGGEKAGKGDALSADDALPPVDSTGTTTLICFLVKLDATIA